MQEERSALATAFVEKESALKKEMEETQQEVYFY